MAKLEGIYIKLLEIMLSYGDLLPLEMFPKYQKNQMRIKEMQMSNIKWK